MTSAQIDAKLTELLGLPAEIEWVEFKEAKNDYHIDRLGEYFSALSNEANLKGQPWAWLVFGVKDKPKQIVGSNYRPNRSHLDSLKEEIANQTNNRLTFEEIYEVVRPEGRVVMFQIPPALRGVPTAWKGHYYGRDNEAIGPLSLHEIEQIRKQATHEDWSAQICEGATLNDLDPQAIAFARQEYKKEEPESGNGSRCLERRNLFEQGQGVHQRQDHPDGDHSAGEAGIRSFSGRFASAIELDPKRPGRHGTGLPAFRAAIPPGCGCGARQDPESNLPHFALGDTLSG